MSLSPTHKQVRRRHGWLWTVLVLLALTTVPFAASTAQEATEEPTVEVTMEPTDEVTPEVTPEDTAEVTPEETSDMTAEPTSEATAEATEPPATNGSGGFFVALEQVASGLSAPIALVSAGDDSGRLFIADQAGQIRVLSADGQLLETPFLDLSFQITPLDEEYDERGVLGLAFHPNYENNGLFYVYYTAPLREGAPEGWDHTNIVAEFSVSPNDPNVADLGTQRIIWSVNHPQMNHNGGQITFGPDGYLYIPLGDGGGANDTDEGHTPGIGNGQDTSNVHGSILRIDIDSGFPYTIPADNPFASPNDGVADEIFAFGLRNPWRIAFDMGGENALYISDAGQELYEEINIVTAGGNYGWNIKEGTHCFDPDNPENPPATCRSTGVNGEPLIDPIIEYDHNLGIVAVGGAVYRGSTIPSWNGYYIFGDYLNPETESGTLFAASTLQRGGLWSFEQIFVVNNASGELEANVLSFGQDDNGEIYVLTSQTSGPTGTTGAVWKLIPVTIASPATATATSEATDDATVEPTSDATDEPTEEVTDEPTEEPTEEVTEEPTEEVTLESSP
jgi:glucose/arabinose dehydrogenase